MELTDNRESEKFMEDETKKHVKEKVQELINIVSELESDFPGRHFTLDGHLLGSIGEVMAHYHYGIELYTASEKTHDGEVDGKKVQIKITQQENILISHKPEHLIALYLNKNGEIYEIYNGPGALPWKSVEKTDSHNYKHLRINKLMELDKIVDDKDRIKMVNKIEKMQVEYKNNKVK